jgi:hypothetical protein
MSTENEPNEELREIIRETARDRRREGLMMLAGGLVAELFSYLIFWLSGPTDELGDIERVFVWAFGYGSMIIGALMLGFGVALIVNAYIMES